MSENQTDPSNSLEELFSRNSAEWTRPDVEKIAKELRARREKFLLQESQGKAVKPKAAPKAMPKPKATVADGLPDGKSLGLFD